MKLWDIEDKKHHIKIKYKEMWFKATYFSPKVTPYLQPDLDLHDCHSSTASSF